MKFGDIDIEKGAVLTFTRDANIKCVVVDDRKVQQGDEEPTYLSPLTTKLLGYSNPVAGGDYWRFEDETLSDRRARLESEKAETD